MTTFFRSASALALIKKMIKQKIKSHHSCFIHKHELCPLCGASRRIWIQMVMIFCLSSRFSFAVGRLFCCSFFICECSPRLDHHPVTMVNTAKTRREAVIIKMMTSQPTVAESLLNPRGHIRTPKRKSNTWLKMRPATSSSPLGHRKSRRLLLLVKARRMTKCCAILGRIIKYEIFTTRATSVNTIGDQREYRVMGSNGKLFAHTIPYSLGLQRLHSFRVRRIRTQPPAAHQHSF